MLDDVAQAAEPLEGPRVGPPASHSSSDSRAQARVAPDPVTSLHDPRALQILSAEHSSLLSTRALAYNESFTRGGMFLAFLSMSFVALALLAQALPLDRDFLLVAAVVLVFDLVVGLTSYARIIGTNYEDYRAVYGMARIRHGYGEIAPVVIPYFTSSIHDDLAGVMVSYGSPPTTGFGAVVYQLTTSASMIGLIVSMIGGVLAFVVAVILGGSASLSVGVAAVAGLGVFVVLAALTIRFYLRVQASLPVLYPTPRDGTGRAPEPRS
jgi:hypothetical protein